MARSFADEEEIVRTPASGELRHRLVSGAPVRDADGAIIGSVCVVRDVTESKRAERALRESEERFRVMFERHMAAMLLIEPDSGQILDANAEAVRFYGYSREQLRAMRIQQINQLSPEEVAAQRRKAVDRRMNEFVFPHRLASGEVRFVEVYSSPVTIQGRPTLFSIIHDVTARRQAEEALERLSFTLAEAQKIAHLGSFEYDAATRRTVWSEEEYRIYGLDPDGPSPAYDVMLARVHPSRRRAPAARDLHQGDGERLGRTSSSTASCSPTAPCAGCTTARTRTSTMTETSSGTSAPRWTSPSARPRRRRCARARRSTPRSANGRGWRVTSTTP